MAAYLSGIFDRHQEIANALSRFLRDSGIFAMADAMTVATLLRCDDGHIFVAHDDMPSKASRH